MKIISNYLEEGTGEAKKGTRLRSTRRMQQDGGRRQNVGERTKTLAPELLELKRIGSDLGTPFSVLVGAFDYYLFIFPVKITIESCKEEIT